MKTYTIELNEKQLRLLNEAVEFTSRWIIGDCGTISWPQAAMRHKEMDSGTIKDWCERRDQLDALMDVVKMIGWGIKHPGSNKGVGYHDDADSLFEMHQAIRHALWKESDDEHKELTKYTLSSQPPVNFYTNEPLIKVAPKAEEPLL
jgi:hypothetical protein